VTDTELGNTVEYSNPRGNFCGRADVAALPGS
jgi:hypothetical protein